VDLAVVSVATIAAALPRLHTLEASINKAGVTPAAVAGFFEDLVPRLRLCHCAGLWPYDTGAAKSLAHAPQPRPLLQELMWDCPFLDDTVGARGFMGAWPVVLAGTYTMVVDWLTAGEAHAAGGRLAWTPLARVRELRFTGFPRGELSAAEVARLMRAAPQLRHLNFGLLSIDLPTWSSDPSFEGLTHPYLRSICLGSNAPLAVLHCAAELRRLHFPRLRYLKVCATTYPVDSSL
jgi:hypothetical protein